MGKGYIVTTDSREQHGWIFEPEKKCLGMVTDTLLTGDYTIKGLEDYVCIERKGSVSEIATNLGKELDRFKRELERMRPVAHKYIICEFSYSSVLKFPYGAGIPLVKLKLVKMTGKIILKNLLEVQMEYGVNVLFCDSPQGAFTMADGIMKRVYEKYGRFIDVN